MQILFFVLFFLLPQAQADDIFKLAVLEFGSVGTVDPNFLQQLSDETRGGALEVFPSNTSKFLILTRENMLDVLAKDGKDASCLKGNCAISIGRNINARFVITGNVNLLEKSYSLRFLSF